MRHIFLGKPIHWALGGLVVLVLMLLGSSSLHVRYFGTYVLLLFAMGLGTLLTILVTSRPGEAITREPLEPTEPAVPATASEPSAPAATSGADQLAEQQAGSRGDYPGDSRADSSAELHANR